jgi:hypothetical protein
MAIPYRAKLLFGSSATISFSRSILSIVFIHFVFHGLLGDLRNWLGLPKLEQDGRTDFPGPDLPPVLL